MDIDVRKSLLFHGALVAVLLVLSFLLPEYHRGNVARIMVLAAYAMSYNILFGYTGLMSLGHAMFFASGMYGLGLSMMYFGWPAGAALLAAAAAGGAVSLATGLLTLRIKGVGFMIVTLMLAEASYLAILHFGAWTYGDDGFIIPQEAQALFGIPLSGGMSRYMTALAVFSFCILVTLWGVHRGFIKVLIAIRENEERTEMLGYDVPRYKLAALVLSGVMAAGAGAFYALLFGYVGASFASVQYSIFALLWVLLGGAGIIIGPFIGVLVMFYLTDLSGALTTAHLLASGVFLIFLALFARQGLVGEIKRRFLPWLI